MTNIHERQPVEFREQSLLTRYREPVDRHLRVFLGQYAKLIPAGSDFLGRMTDYHFGFRDTSEHSVENPRAPGKVLRPTLLLLTTDALGGNWEQTVPAAAGLELAHNSTLMHDDVIDRDTVRHGKPNVLAQYGEGQAVNAGDGAMLLSLIAANDLRDFPDNNVRKVINQLAVSTLQVVEGQAQDLSFEDRRDVTVEEFLTMTDLKTGSLFVGAVSIGAILSGVENEDKINHLKQYAALMGRLFFRDDYLNIWGDPSKTGKKEPYTDLVRRKQSFPVVHAFQYANPQDKALLKAIYGQDKPDLDGDDIPQILGVFERTGTKQATESLMTGLYDRAVTEVKAANMGWSERDYLESADFFAHRDH